MVIFEVKFRTTGRGQVRFNPNLYKDGKVCLSLLGTWPGAQGEQWSKQISTIIQVTGWIEERYVLKECLGSDIHPKSHSGT